MTKNGVLILIVILLLVAGVVFLFSRKIDENQEAVLQWGENTNRDVKRVGNKIVLYDSKHFSNPVNYLVKGIVKVKVPSGDSFIEIRGEYLIGDNGKPNYKNDFQKSGDLYIIENR